MSDFSVLCYLWILINSFLSFFITETLSGFACLSNPCIHGVCVDETNSQYSCYCIDGYTGVQCQTNWDECWSNPCQNGGICIDGIAMFNCTCPPGFVGDLCEENFDECESNPCLNNGTCVDATNGYICSCLPGYMGIHCEIDVAVCNTTEETRCANGGECVEGPGMSFTCKCLKGWGGFLCDVELNECMSAPCQNGGVCIDLHADYLCACRFGFTGKNCEQKVIFCEYNPCKNGALCLMEEGHPVCYCVPDFHGERCQLQYDECQLGPRCMNGGTCIDGIDSFTCSCPPRLTGVFCECLIIPGGDLDCTYISTTSSVILNYTTAFTTSTTALTTSTTAFTTSTTPFSTSTTAFTTSSSLPYTTTETFTTRPLVDNFTTTVSPTYSTEVPNTTSTIFGTSTSTIFETTTALATSTLTTLTTTETSSTVTETTTSRTITEISTTSEPTEETQTEGTTTEFPSTLFNITSTGSTEYNNVTTETTTEATETTTVTTPETTMYATSTEIRTELTTELSTTSTSTSSTTEQTSTPQHTITSSTYSSVPSTTTSWSTTASKTTEFTIPSTTLTETTEMQSFTTTSNILQSTTLKTTETSLMTLLTQTPSTRMQLNTTTAYPISYELTTSIFENVTTTTAIFPDCTREETRCQNGGTCVYEAKGYKCVCPFNMEGPLCEVQIGIRNAAFGGNSYLVHHITNTSGVEVEFKAKTVSENGLLVYSTIDGTYMTLYLEKGSLKFKFSCGYQTMILSELKHPINNGFDTIIYAKLEFSRDLKRCYATVTVNNTSSMSGDQIAMVAKLYRPSSWLYLGGAPPEYSGVLPSSGFVGCMSNLKIFGKKMNIFKDAQDGQQITECSSLACLSNPCKNGGTCIVNKNDWTCMCENGFLGRTCERSVCDNNPCLFGGTCLPFTGSGYICLCPFGKHGQFCENDLQITEAYFSPTIHGYSSYSAYPIPPGGILNNMELRFKFIPTTMDQISILMFIGQVGPHDSASDHIAVSFVKGFIMLTWNLGAGPRRIFTSGPIDKDKEDYLVQLGRSGRRAWLSVEGLGNVTGRSRGNLVQLDVVPMLYLGGYDSNYFKTLPHDLPLHSGFAGCIFDVELKAGSVIIPLQSSRHAIGRAIGQCGITECHENSCQNGGICLHHASTFTCLCQDGWFGPLCSSRFNPCDDIRNNCSANSICVPLDDGYGCDCPFGKIGEFCENDSNLTDVTFSGKRSFLSLLPVELDTARFDIQFELRPLSDRGVIVYISNNGKSFFCLSLQSGFLELRVLPANRVNAAHEVVILRSRKLLAAGVWYKVRVGKFGRKLYISVDKVTNVLLLEKRDHLKITGDTIFLGGLPDLSELPNTAVSTLPVPYKGCLRQLKIDTKSIVLNSMNIRSAQNIDDCDGTPCGGDYCQNGGTCWLDSQLKPHCSCKDLYSGPKCEILPSCYEIVCKNGGRCVNYRCSCTVGFTGAFCETAMRVTTPEFRGNSYIVLKKIDKKRDLANAGLKNLYLNFTTADKDGLIFWGNKGTNFIGIGVEGGYLKLTYTVRNGNHTIIEIPETDLISDGIWHRLEITFSETSLQIKIDGKIVLNQSKKNFIVDLTSLSEGVFFLGGLPHGKNETMWQKTHGMFHEYFKGCIKAFGVNNILSVTDFSSYDGENVGICNVV